MFEPKFALPGTSPLPAGVGSQLATLFADLAKAVENVAEGYHQEYLFKRFLQDRWDRMVGASGSGA
jgi:hypothetical protein